MGKRLKVRVGRSPRSKFEEVKESSKKEEEENVIPSSVVAAKVYVLEKEVFKQNENFGDEENVSYKGV